MSTTETIDAGGARLRLRPWRADTDTAELSSVPTGTPVTPRLVNLALERARDRGFIRVVTPAMPDIELRPYLDGGLVVREHLHLLAHDLADLESRRDVPMRSVRTPLAPVGGRRLSRRDLDRVLAIDHSSFQPFWRLDAAGIDEAVRATPSTRFRLTTGGEGYTLTGRAGDRGYLQRLAVEPSAQGSGLGAALVLDGLWWLRRWRVREALVNTQASNEGALALYVRLGFRSRRHGLSVLEACFGPADPHPRSTPAGAR